MQQIVGRDLGQIHRKLGAIGIGDGMQHHVDLLEQLALGGIGHELLAQLIDVAGAGDFVGVLAAGIDDRRLQGGFLGPGTQQSRGRQRDVRGPDVRPR